MRWATDKAPQALFPYKLRSREATEYVKQRSDLIISVPVERYVWLHCEEGVRWKEEKSE